MRLTKPLCLLTLLCATDAWTCQCLGLSVEEQINQSAYVFRAYVTSAEMIERYPEGDGRVRARFEVIAVLKGNPQELDGIVTPLGGGACEIPIVVGIEYVFFVSPKGEANSCGGTIARRNVDFGNASDWLDFVRKYGLGPE